jgi:hypothetical protein
MKIKIHQTRAECQEVDVAEACRERAAEHMQRHLQNPIRTERGYDTWDNPSKPIDLWTAKLLLEIAELFQKTEPKPF